MNKKLILLTAILGIALLLFTAVSAAPAEPDQFIIDSADGTTYMDLVGSSELEGLISTVAARYVIEYANLNRFVDLVPVPVELQTLLGEVAARYVIEFANQNRFVPLTYPFELIGDTTDPLLLTQVPTVFSGDSLSILWTTNEFTTGVVEYGEQPGVFSGSVADDYFRTQHTAIITGLTSGTIVYYRITMTDRSGNITTSQEYSVEISSVEYFYLPFLKR